MSKDTEKAIAKREAARKAARQPKAKRGAKAPDTTTTEQPSA